MRDFESGPIGETTHKYSDKHAIVNGYCKFKVTHISYRKKSDGEKEKVVSHSDHILRELKYKEGGVYQNKPAVKKFINEFGEETIYNPETGEIISQPDPNSLSKEEQEKRWRCL